MNEYQAVLKFNLDWLTESENKLNMSKVDDNDFREKARALTDINEIKWVIEPMLDEEDPVFNKTLAHKITRRTVLISMLANLF